jgi:YNFM family putative membrane transporter
VDLRDHGFRPGDPAFRRASIALLLAGIATFALLYSTQPLLPALSEAFDVSPAQSSLSLSVATLTLAAGLLITGPISEVVGRRVIMLGSLFGSAAAGVVCALAPTWEVLLASRAVEGFLLAGLPAVGVAYLREEVHPSAAGRAIGLYIGGNAIGGLSGRLICSALTELGGWRTAMFGIAVLGIVCAVAVLALLPESTAFVPAAAGLRAMGARTASALSDPVLLCLYLVGALIMAGFVGLYNAIGFRLEGPPYRLSTAAVGLIFLVYLCGSASSTAAGRLADHIGRGLVVPAGALVMMGGTALTLVSPLPVIVLGLAIMTAGFFVVHGVASGWVAARAQLSGRPVAQSASLYLVLYYGGSSIGGAASTVVWKSGGWDSVVWLTEGLAAGALVVSVVVGRGSRRREAHLRTHLSMAGDAEGPFE